MNTRINKPQGSYISHFSNLVKKYGGINLAQGIPGFQPPQELREELARISDDEIHQYAPGGGNFKLLDLIHQQYSKNFNVDRENFLILQGATEAISLTYTYLVKKFKGDFSALSFDPPYESYSQLPRIFGQKFINFPLNENFSFDKSAFVNVIAKENVKVVFISSPGNPYGKVWTKEEVDTLINLSHQHNFYIIFDAVYNELYFDSPPYLPLDFNSPNVFYANSFSKTLCITGWRIGYLYAHKEHHKELQSIHDYIGLSAPSILQEAIANYLESNNYGELFVERYRNDVTLSFHNLTNSLREQNFHIPPINGGCFVWAKLPDEYPDGFHFANTLYHEHGLACIPGEHFSQTHTNWIRFNIARPINEIKKASLLISNFMSKR